jgi:hypothetical protein
VYAAVVAGPERDLQGAGASVRDLALTFPAVPRIRLHGFLFPRRTARLALRGGCLVARFVFSGLALRRPFAPDAARRENGPD